MSPATAPTQYFHWMSPFASLRGNPIRLLHDSLFAASTHVANTLRLRRGNAMRTGYRHASPVQPAACLCSWQTAQCFSLGTYAAAVAFASACGLATRGETGTGANDFTAKQTNRYVVTKTLNGDSSEWTGHISTPSS